MRASRRRAEGENVQKKEERRRQKKAHLRRPTSKMLPRRLARRRSLQRTRPRTRPRHQIDMLDFEIINLKKSDIFK